MRIKLLFVLNMLLTKRKIVYDEGSRVTQENIMTDNKKEDPKKDKNRDDKFIDSGKGLIVYKAKKKKKNESN